MKLEDNKHNCTKKLLTQCIALTPPLFQVRLPQSHGRIVLSAHINYSLDSDSSPGSQALVLFTVYEFDRVALVLKFLLHQNNDKALSLTQKGTSQVMYVSKIPKRRMRCHITQYASSSDNYNLMHVFMVSVTYYATLLYHHAQRFQPIGRGPPEKSEYSSAVFCTHTKSHVSQTTCKHRTELSFVSSCT